MHTRLVRLVSLATVVALMGVGCRDASAPATANVDGRFVLAQVNGQGLPYLEATATSQDPQQTPCPILLTDGTLLLDAAARTFTIEVNARNACTQQRWLMLTEAGTYVQNSQSLTLVERFPDHVDTLSGQIEPRTISVNGVFHEYAFAR